LLCWCLLDLPYLPVTGVWGSILSRFSVRRFH